MKIEIKNITKSFLSKEGEVSIFNDFSLGFKDNEIVAILGPNGCGKTTLLNLINGIDNDFQGSIKVNNLNGDRDFAYMMQKDLLLPWRNVFKNIALGLEINDGFDKDTKSLVKEYLSIFGIEDLINNYPNNLSGGEKQKVALIRTLIFDSDILLLDEPFSSIDYNTRLELQSKLYEIAKEKKKTVLLVTHDIDEAIAISDRIIILNNKPFGIKEDFYLNLNIANRSPVTTREHSEFSKYFHLIWSSLQNSKTNEKKNI